MLLETIQTTHLSTPK
ncbi:hypothetical protein CFC21_108003, partial [Triticum aestivum]